MNPKVSVIIPCYNQAQFLSEAVDSVLAQTHANTEILIIDDGSTDDTAAVARRYGDRVICLQGPHSGPSRPRNLALDRITGDYVQFLDADDVILPEKIERQLQVMPRGAGLVAGYCDYYRSRSDAVYEPLGDPNDRLTPRLFESSVLLDLARRWETELSIPPICFLFDARIFREHGVRLDESLPNHVDWDCWLQIARLPVRWCYLDAKLAAYRVTPGSITKNRRRMREGFMAAIDKHLRLARHEPELRTILLWKRNQTLRRYDGKIAQEMKPPGRWLFMAGRTIYRVASQSWLRLGLS